MAQVEQSYKERKKSIDKYGACTGVEIPYIAFNATDEDDALSATLAIAPQVYNGLMLETIEIDTRENDTTYRTNAVYKTPDTSDDNNDDDVSTASFSCGGGTKHITHGIKQTIAFGDKNPGGLIGWNGKPGPESEASGLDIPIAQLKETYTRIMRLSQLSTSFKRKVASLVGKVNSGSFKGWSPGEVMFLGMSYSTPAKKATQVTVIFDFAVQMNETNAKVGGKTVSKKGFEYAWCLSKTEVDPIFGLTKVITEAIYVDQVCEYASFSELGL